MSDDGHEIIYEPDEPDEGRGLGRSFFNVAEHDSVQEGFAAIEKYNNPIRTRYRGRTNRRIIGIAHFDRVVARRDTGYQQTSMIPPSSSRKALENMSGMNSCRGMVEEECPIVKWLSWITQAAKHQRKSMKFFVQKIKVFLMQVFI